MIPSIIYVPAILGILTISLVTIYQKTTRDSLYFSLMAFVVSIWLLLQYIAQLVSGSSNVVTFVQASSAVSNLMPLFFYLFVKRVTKSKIDKLVVTLLSLLAAALFLANFFGVMVTKASSNSVGITIEEAGTFYSVQILFSFVVYVYGLLRLIFYGKKTVERKKYRLLALAVGQALFVTVLASVVFPESSIMQVFIVQSFFIMVPIKAASVPFCSL